MVLALVVYLLFFVWDYDDISHGLVACLADGVWFVGEFEQCVFHNEMFLLLGVGWVK